MVKKTKNEKKVNKNKKTKDKKTISDFNLNDQTKKRIIGLVQMKVTPQTVSLFAHDYEDYEQEARLEISEFINFLIEEEYYKLLKNVKESEAPNKSLLIRKRMEFEEKAQNIKKLQAVLRDEKSFKLEKEVDKVEKVISSEENKDLITSPKLNPSKNNSKYERASNSKKESKMDLLLKEASKREAQVKKEEALKKQQQEKIRRELEQQKQKEKEARESELRKQKAAKQEETKKQDKSKKQDINKNMEDQKKIDQEKTQFLNQQMESERQRKKEAEIYAKQQEEKEKLWKELYGNSRNEYLTKQKEKTVELVKKDGTNKNNNLIPSMKTEELKSFTLGSELILVNELIDPKNRLYLFWYKIRTKQKVGNMFTFVTNLTPSQERKLYKKRAKFIRAKLHSSVNNSPKTKLEEKSSVKEKEQKNNNENKNNTNNNAE